MTSTNWMWFATRASGLLSLGLLTCVVLLGIATRGGWAARIWPRAAVTLLHRNLSLLSIVFLSVHIATSVIDGYVNLSWINVVVPFTASYRTLWLGLGTVALDLMLAIIVTSLLRRRIPARWWRSLHLLSYALWAFAVVHSIGAGTDRTVVVVTGGVCAAVVAGAWLAQAMGTKCPLTQPPTSGVERQEIMR